MTENCNVLKFVVVNGSSFLLAHVRKERTEYRIAPADDEYI
jgi:hypothetical protein